jgi:hypothetical protein
MKNIFKISLLAFVALFILSGASVVLAEEVEVETNPEPEQTETNEGSEESDEEPAEETGEEESQSENSEEQGDELEEGNSGESDEEPNEEEGGSENSEEQNEEESQEGGSEGSNEEGEESEDIAPAISLARVAEEPTEEYPYGYITNPDEGAVVKGKINLTAEYYDGDDENDDIIQWAVRAGTCDAGVNTVFGNVDGFDDEYTWDGSMFSSEFNANNFDDAKPLHSQLKNIFVN